MLGENKKIAEKNIVQFYLCKCKITYCLRIHTNAKFLWKARKQKQNKRRVLPVVEREDCVKGEGEKEGLKASSSTWYLFSFF